MAFYNEYPNRKDWRKPRRGGDPACYERGGCPYCEAGRLHKHRRREPLFDWDEFIQERFDDYARYGNEWPTFYVD